MNTISLDTDVQAAYLDLVLGKRLVSQGVFFARLQSGKDEPPKMMIAGTIAANLLDPRTQAAGHDTELISGRIILVPQDYHLGLSTTEHTADTLLTGGMRECLESGQWIKLR